MDWRGLAAEFETPLYVYDGERLLGNFSFFARHVGADALVAVAIKANANVELLRLLAAAGAGADIVSGGELRAARAAGVPPERIVFSGVGKTDREIEEAIAAGVFCLNAESEGEFARIGAIAARTGKMARVSFRLNPNIAISSHPKISTGMYEHKFGLTQDAVLRCCAAVPAGVRVLGAHFHLGSQILDRAPLDALLAQVPAVAGAMQDALGHALEFVNFGGGYGVKDDGRRPAWLGEWLAAAATCARRLGCRPVVEPGRAIFADTGTLLARVIEIKDNGYKRFAIVDAGMNDFVRPAMYGAEHPISRATGPTGSTGLYDVVGPVCESSDTFAAGVELPMDLARGDLLRIHHVGAYGYAMASTYNLRPKPAEILVEKGGTARLIRPRQSLDAL